MTKNKITIQDVAARAGTSPSTVSRVLTGSAPVSEGLRQSVERAIAELGYRPSLVARSLKTQTTYTVGLLVNDITNPFFSALARGVEEEANGQGYSLILCNTNEDPERELKYLQILRDKQVDGIIFGPTGRNDEFIRSLAGRIPLVQIDRQMPGLDAPAVLVDNEKAAYQATRLLVERGHERIAMLGWGMDITTSTEREAGYERALREAGIALDTRLLARPSQFSHSTLVRAAEELLAQQPRPTAIFAANNRFGIATLAAIRRFNLTVPDDVALVVFDDIDAFSLMSPSITAVAQPALEMGRVAMDLMLRLIRTADEAVPPVTLLPTELIVRESV
ncbi:MAG TPA: LacI family DNA-binding transcriptional regulator [Aggregatilineales bacterium]|nr:LacI family DNA-binding transcriptional regulator [Aggregatilineales bacterium]HQE19398.1 LacI family DNA-binding transcriptional regulator [Aggregatilineales bacterium]